MNRRFLIIAGIALAIVAAFAVFGFWGNIDWGTHAEITRVIPGENGETLIIQDGGHDRFVPFFPFFLFFPLLWILVIGGLFTVFGRRRWGGGPAFGQQPENRDAWLAAWHQQQHAGAAAAGTESPETLTPPEP